MARMIRRYTDCVPVMPAEILHHLLTVPAVMILLAIGTEETRIATFPRVTGLSLILTVIGVGFCNIVFDSVLVTAGLWCARPVPKSHGTQAHPLALAPWIVHSWGSDLGRSGPRLLVAVPIGSRELAKVAVLARNKDEGLKASTIEPLSS